MDECQINHGTPDDRDAKILFAGDTAFYITIQHFATRQKMEEAQVQNKIVLTQMSHVDESSLSFNRDPNRNLLVTAIAFDHAAEAHGRFERLLRFIGTTD